MNLEDIRRDYLLGGLRRRDLPPEPLSLFETWLALANQAQLADATACNLATVDASGQPRQRIVLLKGMQAEGLVFFTNYESQKARDMAVNNKVSLHFSWLPLERQVAICGTASKLDEKANARYFASRPRESQYAAWASEQSQVIESRSALEEKVAQMHQRFVEEIPCPTFWGGFCVAPESMEFWQGGANRLHDRFLYRRQGDAWNLSRLQP